MNYKKILKLGLIFLFSFFSYSYITNGSIFSLAYADSTVFYEYGVNEGGGSTNGLLNYPNGSVFDNSKNIYVVDTSNNRIQKFDSNGTYLSQWGTSGTGNGQFSSPMDIARDSNGYFYITDTGNNRIERFDSNGTYVGQWGSSGSGNSQFNSPQGISLDSSNNVYVVDSGNKRIQKFSNTGTYITQWGSSGSGNGQFSTPTEIAIDSNNLIYVVDSGNNRIQIFSNTGTYTSQFGSTGTGLGQFNYPDGIAIDASNNVLVSDGSNYRIQKLTNTGSFLSQWGSSGSTNDKFGFPTSISIDSTGNIFVTDRGNNRIQKFNNTGTYITKWGTIPTLGSADGQYNNPTDIAVDSNGNIFIDDTTNYRIQKINSSGTFVSKWGSQGTGNTQLNLSSSIAVDASNNVYAVDTFNNRIIKFDNNGTYINKWGSSGTGNGQFSNPQGIAIDSLNNIYISDTGNNRIQKFDSTGTYITQWGSSGTGNGQFNDPREIATDSSNNIYVTDKNNNRIQKFDSTGTYITQWGSSGTGNGQFNSPFGIIIDGNNNVFVSDSANNRIQEFSSSGTFINKWGGTASAQALGQFYSPRGLSKDSSNNIYITDSQNQRIIKMQIIGSPTISTITPNFDILAGGKSITISGTNFITGVTSVTIGGNTCSNTTVSSSTLLTCTTPAGTEGLKDVTIITDGGSATLSNAFNYVGTPTITAISPTSGPQYGGTTVTITGTNFTTGTITASIGGSNCSNGTYIDTNHISCVTGIHTIGSSTVTLTVNGQAGTSASNIYTYTQTPQITMNENATNVIGQTTFTTNTTGLTNSTLNNPRGISYDKVNHLLFIPEYNNNRVTIYDLNNIQNGQTAKYVLGQTSFTTNTCATTQSGLCYPQATAYDSVNKRLFVVDGGRVVVYNLSGGITNGMNASYVLGKTSFTDGVAALTQSGMNFPTGAEYDEVNQRLFVADPVYNRITVYNLSGGITNGMNASYVIGQSSFTTSTAATTQSGLSAPRSATYDPTNNRLFVIDISNNRVVVYNLSGGITNGMNASYVFGQTSFTTSTATTTQSGLNTPRILAYDTNNSRLFIGDTGNNRVTVYNIASGITNGMNASLVLGQPNFLTNTSTTTTQASINAEYGLAYDSENNRLLVADLGNSRITTFNATPNSTSPTITTISPIGGPAAGNQTVTITGTNFVTGNTTIYFGSSACTAVTVISPTSLTCTTPSQTAGIKDIVAITNAGATTLTNSYTYYAPPTITTISPTSGSVNGGETITINGTNFRSGTTVSFGGAVATSVNFISSTQLTAIAPASVGGTVTVTATTPSPDSQTATLKNGYTYNAPPSITNLSQSHGPSQIAHQITITGQYFNTSATVKIGELAATINSINSTQIVVTLPAQSAKKYSLVVTNPDGQTATTNYTYDPPPIISSQSINSGKSSGGETISITGTNFQSGITATIGGTSATVNYTNTTNIDIITPAHNAGTYDILLTNPDGQTVTATSSFTFYNAPVVTSLSPNTAELNQKVDITVTGTDFRNDLTASLIDSQEGSSSCSPSNITSTSFVCTITLNKISTGLAHLIVTNPDSQKSTNNENSAFTINIPTPTISTITPAKDTTIGGQTVVIVGSNFYQINEVNPTVKFGDTEATTINYISDTQIEAIVPAHAAGVVSVSVNNNGGTTTTLSDSFTYEPPSPKITRISPLFGSTTGNETITIYGQYFQQGATVNFDSIPATNVTVSQDGTSITVKSPTGTGAPYITVTNPDGKQTSSSTLNETISKFQYTTKPEISSITPTEGPSTGNTTVTITGNNFLPEYQVTISITNPSNSDFNEIKVPITIYTQDLISTQKMQADCSSIKFLDQNNTPISYWYDYSTCPTISGNYDTTYTLLFPVIKANETITIKAIYSLYTQPYGYTEMTAATQQNGDPSPRLVGTEEVAMPIVKFGTEKAISSKYNSATEITTVSPAHPAGTVDVQITNPDGQTTDNTTNTKYTYLGQELNLVSSQITASPGEVLANGNDKSIVTVTVYDQNNIGISGKTIELTTEGTTDGLTIQSVLCSTTQNTSAGITNSNGQACFAVSSTKRGSIKFSAKINESGTYTQLNSTVTVSFTCPANKNQQCVSVDITGSVIPPIFNKVPSSFSFPPTTVLTTEKDQFTHHIDTENPTNYKENQDDTISIQDTAGTGNWTVTVALTTPFQNENNRYIPLSDFLIATTASKINPDSSVTNGIEYSPASVTEKNIEAPFSIDTECATDTSCLIKKNNFTKFNGLNKLGTSVLNTDPSVTQTPLIIMNAPASTSRSGTFSENLNYYLKIPALQPVGSYKTTVTFDLIQN